MAISLADKKAIVADLADIAGQSLSVVTAEYRGLSVDVMSELRCAARAKQVVLRVARNTLARRALKDSAFECISDTLTGPLFLAFSKDEPGAAAKLLRDFAKDHDQLIVKALSIDGQLMGAEELGVLADLPTREEALTKLVCVLKAPITKFVRTLAEPHAKLVRTVAAVKDQKQAAA